MTKEQVYNEEFFPLVERLHELCEKHDISMFASFDITEESELKKIPSGAEVSAHLVNSHKSHINKVSLFLPFIHLLDSSNGLELVGRTASLMVALDTLKQDILNEGKVTH